MIWKTQREGVSCLLQVRQTDRQSDRQTDRSTACDGSKDIVKYSCRNGTSLSFCLYTFLAGPILWFCVTVFHVLCHGLSCFVSRFFMFCVTDCHVLRHGLPCIASRIAMPCVTDCHVLSRIVMFCHGFSCIASRIVMSFVRDCHVLCR